VVRILLVDREELIREALAALLANAEGLRVSGEAANLSEMLEFLRMSSVDVVLVGARLPDAGSLSSVLSIREVAPRCGILVLASRPDHDLGVRLVRGGANGYLTRDRSSKELVAAVQRVADGKRHITQRLAERLVDDGRDGGLPPHERLTDREFEILQLTARGVSGTDIADELDVTPQTVSTHRSRIRKKLELDSVAAMVRYALERGID